MPDLQRIFIKTYSNLQQKFTSKVYLESKYEVIIVLLWTMRDKHELAGTEITFVTVAKICGCKEEEKKKTGCLLLASTLLARDQALV